MSIVFYGFEAKDENNLKEQIEEMKRLTKLKPAQYFLFTLTGVKIQVFNTAKKIYWRVLESDYGLRNILWKNESGLFTQFSVDTRSGVVSKKQEKIIDEIDNLIQQKKYRIIEIVKKDNKNKEKFEQEIKNLDDEEN